MRESRPSLALVQMCVQVHLCSFQFNFADSSSRVLYERVASRTTWFLCSVPGAVDVLARLREAVVNSDPLRADVGNRRLGPLARIFLLCGGRRLQPLEWVSQLRSSSSTAAANVVHSSETSREQCVLGDREPRPQLPELLLGLVGSRGQDG